MVKFGNRHFWVGLLNTQMRVITWSFASLILCSQVLHFDSETEKTDRLGLVDFLKGLLEFDPNKRWSPLQVWPLRLAQFHPNCYAHSKFRGLGLQACLDVLPYWPSGIIIFLIDFAFTTHSTQWQVFHSKNLISRITFLCHLELTSLFTETYFRLNTIHS